MAYKNATLLKKNRPNTLPRPALKGADDEEREHGMEDVVVMEGGPLPGPLLHHRQIDVAVRK